MQEKSLIYHPVFVKGKLGVFQEGACKTKGISLLTASLSG